MAEKFHLTIETLHYWELVGAIPSVHRDASGQRDYDQEDLDWINFARCMRQAGVSIKCLRRYIQLFKRGPHTEIARKKLLSDQLMRIGKRIQKLTASYRLLDWKVHHIRLIDQNYHGKFCHRLRKGVIHERN